MAEDLENINVSYHSLRTVQAMAVILVPTISVTEVSSLHHYIGVLPKMIFTIPVIFRHLLNLETCN